MDNSLIIILMATIAIMFIANSSIGKAKVPQAIKKLKSTQIWGISFFDNNRWLKWIGIFIVKIIAETLFGLWRLISTGIQMGTPKFFKKIGKGF